MTGCRTPYLISLPKGINASFASLNCCSPKGMPTTVMQSRAPMTTDSMARGRPETTSQMIFNRKEPAPLPYTPSFPKGKKLRLANLKHCSPT